MWDPVTGECLKRIEMQYVLKFEALPDGRLFASRCPDEFDDEAEHSVCVFGDGVWFKLRIVWIGHLKEAGCVLQVLTKELVAHVLRFVVGGNLRS